MIQPRVFISHAPDDLEWVLTFKETLRKIGFLVWVSQPEAAQQGDHVQELMMDTLTNSDAVIPVLSQSGIANANVLFEIGLAIGSGRTIVPVVSREVDMEQIPIFRGQEPHLEVEQDQPADTAVRIAQEIKCLLYDQATAGAFGRSIWKEVDQAHRSQVPRIATRNRLLGRAARSRGELEQAVQYLKEAVALADEYCEAKYDLALTMSMLKDEGQAEQLAREVVESCERRQDDYLGMKAHNLLSGIYRRTGRHMDALAEIRIAYELAHSPRFILEHRVPHIVPIRNRLILEKLCGDASVVPDLLKELAAHPGARTIWRDFFDGVWPDSRHPRF